MDVAVKAVGLPPMASMPNMEAEVLVAVEERQAEVPSLVLVVAQVAMETLAGYGVVLRVAVVRRRATRQMIRYRVRMDAVTGGQARMLAVAQASLVEPLVAVEPEGLGLTPALGEQVVREQMAQLEFTHGR